MPVNESGNNSATVHQGVQKSVVSGTSAVDSMFSAAAAKQAATAGVADQQLRLQDQRQQHHQEQHHHQQQQKQQQQQQQKQQEHQKQQQHQQQQVVAAPTLNALHQVGGPQQQMMQGEPRTQVTWEGQLQWKENVTAADGGAVSSGNETVHTVKCRAKAKASTVSGHHCIHLGNSLNCTIFFSVLQGAGQVCEVEFQNWPQTLILQLIPKEAVRTIGQFYKNSEYVNLWANSKTVYFHPEPSDSLEVLTKVLSSGYAGCVHYTGKFCFTVNGI